jgi:hypothetical protein
MVSDKTASVNCQDAEKPHLNRQCGNLLERFSLPLMLQAFQLQSN